MVLKCEGQNCSLGSGIGLGQKVHVRVVFFRSGGLTKVEERALGCPASTGSFSNPGDSLSLGFCSLLEFALTYYVPAHC